MSTARDVLAVLYQHHSELADVREKLRKGPIVLRGREKRLAELQQAIDDQKEALKRLKMETDKRELDLKQGEAKVADLNVKLNMTRSAKEFDTLKEEIRARSEKNDELEQGILEALELQESDAASIEVSEASYREEAEKFEQFESDHEYSMGKLKARVELLEAEIAKVAKDLPGEASEPYRRLIKIKGVEGLSPSTNGNCQACGTAVTPQQRNELERGKGVVCLYCGVLLFEESGRGRP